jgi:hypothetical protein
LNRADLRREAIRQIAGSTNFTPTNGQQPLPPKGE